MRWRRKNLRTAIALGVSLMALSAQPDELGASYATRTETVAYGGGWYKHHTKTPTANVVRLLDLSTRADGLVWQGDSPLEQVKLSPSGNHVGFVEQRESAEPNVLRIVTTDGQEAASVAGVQRFEWSPQGRAVAYIKGRYVESGLGFRSDGVEIMDLVSKEIKPVPLDGYVLSWAEFDGNLYIWKPAPRD